MMGTCENTFPFVLKTFKDVRRCSAALHQVIQRIEPFKIAPQVQAIEIDIVAGHIHRGMTQKGLKLNHAAARKDKVLCEGVTEQVD